MTPFIDPSVRGDAQQPVDGGRGHDFAVGGGLLRKGDATLNGFHACVRDRVHSEPKQLQVRPR